MAPVVDIPRATDLTANSAPRRTRRRAMRARGALRPITSGLAVLGATALVGAFITPAPDAHAAAVSAPTPTPLLAALTLPSPQAQIAGALDTAARIGIDLDADLILRGGVPGLLARLGAALRLDVDIDTEQIGAAFAALINDIAAGIDGGIDAANGVVDLGAALVSQLALAASAAGVDVVDAITGALLSTLAALTPEGGIGVQLAASIEGAITGIGELFARGITGAGAAVAWKATLDDVLVDLAATGGIALTNGIAGGLLAALGVTPELPDIDGGDVAEALGALITHYADGINGALLNGQEAIELGVSVINGLVSGVAETGVDIRGAITGALLSSLAALVPAGSPFADAVVELVGDVSAGIDAGIRGVGDAIEWKFMLDDVLADVFVTGGVSLVNGITTGLFGGLGLPLPELPAVDFAASVRALIDHFAVALGVRIDVGAGAGAGGGVEGGGEGGAGVDGGEMLSRKADKRVAAVTDDVDPNRDATPADDEQAPSDGAAIEVTDEQDGADVDAEETVDDVDDSSEVGNVEEVDEVDTGSDVEVTETDDTTGPGNVVNDDDESASADAKAGDSGNAGGATGGASGDTGSGNNDTGGSSTE